jgi:hypothetical protein
MMNQAPTVQYNSTRSWVALNGHTMEYYATEDGRVKPGAGAFAWCVDTCKACEAGDILPDY